MRFSNSYRKQRKGAVLPIVTVCLVGLLAFVALAIDIGLLAVARTQCQAAADIAALAGARTLNGEPGQNYDLARAQALTAATNNSILTTPITNAQVVERSIGVYRYDTTAQRFLAVFGPNENSPPSLQTNEGYGAVRVRIITSQQTYFARVLGINSMNVGAVASAAHRPRDVSIILDFSGSMKFSSEFNYPPNVNSTLHSSGSAINIMGGLNPDPVFPRFGPWSIYPVNIADTTVTGTQNPMQRLTSFVDSGGEAHSTNNITMATASGPAIVENFQITASPTSAKAFVSSSATFNPSATPVCTPAPASWCNSQYVPDYVGDRFPLKNGLTSPTSASDYARNVADIRNIASPGNSTYDATWETNGYGNNFLGYSMGPGYYGKTFYMWPPDPRSNRDWRKKFFRFPGPNATTKGAVMDDNSRLWASNGIWNRQFRNIDGTSRATTDPNYIPDYDAILSWLTSGPAVLPPSLRAGRVVYYTSIPTSLTNVVDWQTGLMRGSPTEDQRFWKDYIDFVLGAGRFYNFKTLYGNNTSNSFNGTTYGGSGVAIRITPKANLTAAFPNPAPYMHYLDNPVHPRLHTWFGPLTMLAFLGVNSDLQDWNWYAGTTNEAQTWQLKAGIRSALNDIRINHPNDLACLIYFSSLNNYNTARVSMSKDYTRMTNAMYYPFSLLNSLGNVNSERRPYGTTSFSTGNPNGLSDTAANGDIPNANGGTNPAMGLAVAYNQFQFQAGFTGRRGASKLVILETDGVANQSLSTGTLLTQSGSPATWQYIGIANGSSVGNGNINALRPALALAWQIRQKNAAPFDPWIFSNSANTAANPTNHQFAQNTSPYTSLTPVGAPGYSTARQPARLHALAFGELFEPTTNSTSKTSALRFLLDFQRVGGTSTLSDTSIEPYKIITGDADTRIDKIRQALERIMQSGVQVALIQ